jgi:hypothetical protein
VGLARSVPNLGYAARVRATDNPFESPKAELEPDRPAATGSDEQVRRELLNHEASIKAIGRLDILGGVVAVLVGFGMLADTEAELPAVVGATAIFMAIGVVSAWVGNKLRTLDPRGRVAAAVLHGLGLFGFPVGTLVSAYVLWLVLSEKGRRVLSTEYQGVVERTPHIKYKTPIVLVVLAALVLGLLLLGMVASLFGA